MKHSSDGSEDPADQIRAATVPRREASRGRWIMPSDDEASRFLCDVSDLVEGPACVRHVGDDPERTVAFDSSKEWIAPEASTVLAEVPRSNDGGDSLSAPVVATERNLQLVCEFAQRFRQLRRGN